MPLAARMRPASLEEYLGQEKVVGPGTLLRRAIEEDRLFSSILLWGPPGTGKTTLAHLIAKAASCHFTKLSAVIDGVKELRKVVAEAEERRRQGRRTLLLVDEIHRFNKAQQDALLPHVEEGTVLLMGATTENPYFEVNQALLSRSRLFCLEKLTSAHLKSLVQRALQDPDRGYGRLSIEVEPEAVEHLVATAGGDARTALNTLELAVESAGYGESGQFTLDLSLVEQASQRKTVRYDKGGDSHYDVTSAFIKSIRGSDPDAAFFWLARMVRGGEDPKFIMRRLLILAAEDVGLADPSAISVVSGCARALEWVGLPEAKYHLALATGYLATAPKSNSLQSYFEAERALDKVDNEAVPLHLRDGHYKGAAQLGHGRGYLYPHDFPKGYVEQQYLPDQMVGSRFYQPSDHGYEKVIARRMAHLREEGG